MKILPHISDLVPEVYEHKPIYHMAWKGIRNEVRMSSWMFNSHSANRFLIFAQGRTGSTLMTSTLNKHSRICCEDEILGVPRLFPRTFIENSARASGADCYGFHVKIYQLVAWQRIDNVGRFLNSLATAGWQIIYIWRENLLRHAVSNIFAENAGTYHDFGSGHARSVEKVYVPLERLFADFEIRSRQRKAEQRALNGLPFLELCYEKDLEPTNIQRITFARVQEFLNIEQEELIPELKKMVRAPLKQLVTNYEEIVAALSGRVEERFLDGNY